MGENLVLRAKISRTMQFDIYSAVEWLLAYFHGLRSTAAIIYTKFCSVLTERCRPGGNLFITLLCSRHGFNH